MSEPIEETYFNWLTVKVMPLNSDIYQGLLLVLHRTEFHWVLLGDDNREADGLDLRLDFLAETNVMKERLWFDTPASVLEVLIALAKDCSDQTGISVERWFWKFIENLRLEEYRRISDADVPRILQILEAWLYRLYSPSGEGGLFPLGAPPRDQRKVEIWYQFCDYVQDQQLI